MQDRDEHEKTKKVVEAFLQQEGPRWQEKLIQYDKTVDSYIEEFWCKSYSPLARRSEVFLGREKELQS
jgi:carnitine O-acetyltransferase